MVVSSAHGEYEAHGRREPFPGGRVIRELPPAGAGEFIELRLPIVVTRPPLGGDQPLPLQAVQRRVERPLGDLHLSLIHI